MREQLIHKYIKTDQIYGIIGHDKWTYILAAARYSVLVIFLGLLFFFVIQKIGQPFLQSLRAAVGLFLYFKLMYDIFDEYLDTIVITDKGLIHFRREGLWKQKTELLQWVSVESVSHEQNTFFDTLVNKGDVKIKLEDTIVLFKDIHNPGEASNLIIDYKDKILGRHNYLENEQHPESGKYNILIEALGEVVTDYVHKKKEDTYY